MAISYATLEIKEAGGVHTITMNRPDRRNALNPQMIAELTHALTDSAACPCGVVVPTGAGTDEDACHTLATASAADVAASVKVGPAATMRVGSPSGLTAAARGMPR